MKRLLIFVVLIFLASSVFALCNSTQIDVNTASLEELDKIIWVGIPTAEKIIANRTYDSVDDLIRVSGIGDTKLNDIKNQGLACVSGEENNSDDESQEEEENVSEDEELESKVVANSSESETKNTSYENPVDKEQTVQSTQKITAETIKLTSPKDIKSKTNFGKLISDNAFAALAVFSAVIVFLLLLKKRNSQKNEFQT